MKGDIAVDGVEHHVRVDGGTARFQNAIVLTALGLRGGRVQGVVYVRESTVVETSERCDHRDLTIIRKPDDELTRIAALTQMS